jgi:hypothetical protein
MSTRSQEGAVRTAGAADAGPAAVPTHGGGYRSGAVLALLGAALLGIGTVLHPVPADPGDALAAFTEYAADSRGSWFTAHLTQLVGVAAMTSALVLLSRSVAGPSGSGASRATTVFGSATVAVAAALQAVDGVALKAMVDAWSAAAVDEEQALFAATLAVRQVETGLAGVFAILLAATTSGFGWVLLTAPGGSRVVAGAAVVAAAAGAIGGVLMCLEGFSGAAMTVGMGSGVLGLLTMLVVAGWSWRRGTARHRRR